MFGWKRRLNNRKGTWWVSKSLQHAGATGAENMESEQREKIVTGLKHLPFSISFFISSLLPGLTRAHVMVAPVGRACSPGSVCG